MATLPTATPERSRLPALTATITAVHHHEDSHAHHYDHAHQHRPSPIDKKNPLSKKNGVLLFHISCWSVMDHMQKNGVFNFPLPLPTPSVSFLKEIIALDCPICDKTDHQDVADQFFTGLSSLQEAGLLGSSRSVEQNNRLFPLGQNIDPTL